MNRTCGEEWGSRPYVIFHYKCCLYRKRRRCVELNQSGNSSWDSRRKSGKKWKDLPMNRLIRDNNVFKCIAHCLMKESIIKEWKIEPDVAQTKYKLCCPNLVPWLWVLQDPGSRQPLLHLSPTFHNTLSKVLSKLSPQTHQTQPASNHALNLPVVWKTFFHMCTWLTPSQHYGFQF